VFQGELNMCAVDGSGWQNRYFMTCQVSNEHVVNFSHYETSAIICNLAKSRTVPTWWAYSSLQHALCPLSDIAHRDAKKIHIGLDSNHGITNYDAIEKVSMAPITFHEWTFYCSKRRGCPLILSDTFSAGETRWHLLTPPGAISREVAIPAGHNKMFTSCMGLIAHCSSSVLGDMYPDDRFPLQLAAFQLRRNCFRSVCARLPFVILARWTLVILTLWLIAAFQLRRNCFRAICAHLPFVILAL
jgi:hypothetical protein